MKKILLLTLLTLISFSTSVSANSNNKALIASNTNKIPVAKIDGIGKYKIGLDLNAFLSEHTIIKKFTPNEKYSIESSGVSGVYEEVGFVEKISTSYLATGNFDPKARVFYIKNFQIAGFTINLELLFFENKLIYIESPTYALQDAFLAKYGQGKISRETKIENCSDKNNRVQKIETFDLKHQWINGDVSIIARIQEMHTIYCEIAKFTYIRIAKDVEYQKYTARNKSFSKGKENSTTKQNHKLDEL